MIFNAAERGRRERNAIEFGFCHFVETGAFEQRHRVAGAQREAIERGSVGKGRHGNCFRLFNSVLVDRNGDRSRSGILHRHRHIQRFRPG